MLLRQDTEDGFRLVLADKDASEPINPSIEVKVRNWLVDDELNRDWLKLLLHLLDKKAGSFITAKDGQVIFIGGPSSGGGSEGGGGYVGTVGFTDIGTAAGRALYSGDIGINKAVWDTLPEEGKRFVLAHEVVHHTVEEDVLNDQAKWDAALEPLTVRTVSHRTLGEVPLFVGGNTRIGEAVTDAVAATLLGARFGNLDDAKWAQVQRWAEGAIQAAGYEKNALQGNIERFYRQLEG